MDLKEIKLDFLGHSGFLITLQSGKKIAIDPYNLSKNVPQVDLILITHGHYDHCSIKDIERISREGTTIIIPADSQSKITKIKEVNMHVVEPGDEFTLGNIKIETLPAYNTDKQFHTKKEGWLGYILKIGNTIIYHAGDTDRIPEMSRLTGYGKHNNNFIALLPVSGKFVMDPEEAAEVAQFLSPDLCIPMHFGAGVAGTHEDAERFVRLCRQKGLKAEILEKI